MSCPSSLQDHSDFPSTRNACLAGFIQLGLRLPPSDHDGSRGISGPISHPLSLHGADLTPGPPPVHLPFSSRRTLAFPQNVRGRRVALFSQSLSLYRALPIIFARSELTRLHHSFSYYGLQVWPAPLIGFAAPCRGKFRPDVTTRTRPQPTYLQLAIGMAGSFHPASGQFRYLIHVKIQTKIAFNIRYFHHRPGLRRGERIRLRRRKLDPASGGISTCGAFRAIERFLF